MYICKKTNFKNKKNNKRARRNVSNGAKENDNLSYGRAHREKELVQNTRLFAREYTHAPSSSSPSFFFPPLLFISVSLSASSLHFTTLLLPNFLLNSSVSVISPPYFGRP